MRIVIDTNVLYSALYSNKGASHFILKWLFTSKNPINVVSVPLVNEYEDVLTRKDSLENFKPLLHYDVINFIHDICVISYKQEINFLWRPFLSDVKDDMVLETAFNSGAEFIITHNIRDFKQVNKFFQISVIRPNSFVTLLKQRGLLP